MRRPAEINPLNATNKTFLDYFRCSVEAGAFEARGELSADEGYFTFDGTICYGRRFGGPPALHITDPVPDVSNDVEHHAGGPRLPFDLAEIVLNLQEERYRQSAHSGLERVTSAKAFRRLYYLLRPLLPVPVRKHLQKIRLGGWKDIPFPKWPLDVSVQALMQSTMGCVLESRGVQRIPFIWFWPDGARATIMMTHDVEGEEGRRFCSELMDLDESFGIKAAFQIVPETHWQQSTGIIEALRGRGFEVNLHDFNHDGDLFHDRKLFLQRAAVINQYARDLGCRGFRAGSMYREQQWFDAFEFSFDMSVPNAAHLEPQRGGCCTVMPYFVGNLLELPLTTTQDYSLLHILGDYSIQLWQEQIDSILAANGLISFITHPDYLIERRARRVYRELLEHLSRLRSEHHLWVALPGEIDSWWRSRHA
ncbi:MAG: hypothetical protein M3545_10830, partial [Acidobacteriota bacterium]|nr:hypothetical protein [Acidobacteriota bacterium]